MAKKQQIPPWAWIIIILLVIIFLKRGGFERFVITEVIGATPSDFENTPLDPTCTFNFDKSIACVGEDVTGTITDGSLKRCVVAYDYENTGWVIVSIEDLDIDGIVTETRSADVAGTYVWTALCGYFDGEIFIAECRTNDETIEIIDCDENGDEAPTYTCGWVGEQCDGTCPPSHPLCVDMWFEQNVLWMDGGYSFCACIDPNTETVHPDWKPGGQYHDDSGGEFEDGLICFDDDVEQDIYFKGTCTPIGGIPEEDFCPTDTAVTQMWCSEDGMSCWGASYFCPDGEICVDGACVVGYEYQDNINPDEAIPGLNYGEEDMHGCISDYDCLQMCQLFVDFEVDSAYCEEFSQRMIPCSEGWNNCGGGEGEGDWYCCFFDDCDSYLQGPCCDGAPTCTCVCERWYIAGY